MIFDILIFDISYFILFDSFVAQALRIVGGAPVRKKITKTRSSALAVVGDDENANPSAEFGTMDIGLISRCFAIQRIDIASWISSKSLADVNEMIAINEAPANEINTTQKMLGYAGFVDEMERLEVLLHKFNQNV